VLSAEKMRAISSALSPSVMATIKPTCDSRREVQEPSRLNSGWKRRDNDFPEVYPSALKPPKKKLDDENPIVTPYRLHPHSGRQPKGTDVVGGKLDYGFQVGIPGAGFKVDFSYETDKYAAAKNGHKYEDNTNQSNGADNQDKNAGKDKDAGKDRDSGGSGDRDGGCIIQ